MNYDEEKIKQIILTDYIDGRLDASEKQKIDDIIAQHEELQSFYAQAVGRTVEPFSGGQGDVAAPAGVWQSIEDRLDALDQRTSVFDRIFQPFLQAWEQPRLVLSGGLAIALLVFAFFFFQNRQNKIVRYNKEAQIEYFMLLAETNPPEKLETMIIETRLEKYFL